jgi:hypothetical protein
MTSYQLPDLLTLVNSLAGDDDDGDLYINPLYNNTLNIPSFKFLEASTGKEGQGIKISRLQRTTAEFVREFNSALLSSVFVPFPSFPEPESQPVRMLKRASEWLAMCAITTEQVLRPGRLVDFGSAACSLTPSCMGGDGSLWETYVSISLPALLYSCTVSQW